MQQSELVSLIYRPRTIPWLHHAAVTAFVPIHDIDILHDPRVVQTFRHDRQQQQQHSHSLSAAPHEQRAIPFDSDAFDTLHLPGEGMITAGRDATIRMWSHDDSRTLIGRSVLDGHSDWVSDLVLLKDQRTLLSSSADHLIKMWDVQTGQCVSTLVQHTDFVEALSYAPDCNAFVSAGLSNQIYLWQLDEARTMPSECLTIASPPVLASNTPAPHSTSTPPFASSAASALSASTTSTATRNTSKSTSTSTLGASASRSSRSSQSPSGGNGRGRGGDGGGSSTGGSSGGGGRGGGASNSLDSMEEYAGSFYSIQLSADGRRLVSGSTDRVVRVWDMRTCAPWLKLLGHTGNIQSVLLNRTADRCISLCSDGLLKVWDLRNQRCAATIPFDTSVLAKMRPSAALSTASSSSTRSSSSHARRTPAMTSSSPSSSSSPPPRFAAYNMCVDEAFSRVFIGGTASRVFVTDLGTSVTRAVCDLTSAAVKVHLDHDASRLWVSTRDNTISAWDVDTILRAKSLDDCVNDREATANRDDAPRSVGVQEVENVAAVAPAVASAVASSVASTVVSDTTASSSSADRTPPKSPQRIDAEEDEEETQAAAVKSSAVTITTTTPASATTTTTAATTLTTSTDTTTEDDRMQRENFALVSTALLHCAGFVPLVRARTLYDGRNVLTTDTHGLVCMWDVLHGRVAAKFEPGTRLEDVLAARNAGHKSMPAWFQVDLRFGCLCLTFDPRNCFNAQYVIPQVVLPVDDGADGDASHGGAGAGVASSSGDERGVGVSAAQPALPPTVVNFAETVFSHVFEEWLALESIAVELEPDEAMKAPLRRAQLLFEQATAPAPKGSELLDLYDASGTVDHAESAVAESASVCRPKIDARTVHISVIVWPPKQPSHAAVAAAAAASGAGGTGGGGGGAGNNGTNSGGAGGANAPRTVRPPYFLSVPLPPIPESLLPRAANLRALTASPVPSSSSSSSASSASPALSLSPQHDVSSSSEYALSYSPAMVAGEDAHGALVPPSALSTSSSASSSSSSSSSSTSATLPKPRESTASTRSWTSDELLVELDRKRALYYNYVPAWLQRRLFAHMKERALAPPPDAAGADLDQHVIQWAADASDDDDDDFSDDDEYEDEEEDLLSSDTEAGEEEDESDNEEEEDDEDDEEEGDDEEVDEDDEDERLFDDEEEEEIELNAGVKESPSTSPTAQQHVHVALSTVSSNLNADLAVIDSSATFVRTLEESAQHTSANASMSTSTSTSTADSNDN